MKSSIKSMKASLWIIQRKSLSDPFHILYKSGSFLPSTNCQSRLNGCNRRKEFFRQWNLQPMLVVVGWALVWARRNKSIILYLAGCSGSVTLGGSQDEYFFLERHNFITIQGDRCYFFQRRILLWGFFHTSWYFCPSLDLNILLWQQNH